MVRRLLWTVRSPGHEDHEVDRDVMGDHPVVTKTIEATLEVDMIGQS